MMARTNRQVKVTELYRLDMILLSVSQGYRDCGEIELTI